MPRLRSGAQIAKLHAEAPPRFRMQDASRNAPLGKADVRNIDLLIHAVNRAGEILGRFSLLQRLDQLHGRGRGADFAFVNEVDENVARLGGDFCFVCMRKCGDILA